MRALAFGLCLVPQDGVALSCDVPDAAWRFLLHERSEDTFSIVNGTFIVPQGAQMAGQSARGNGDGWSFDAVFVGSYLSSQGWISNFETSVTVSINCFLHYCGSVPSHDVGIFFFEKRGDVYEYAVGPCDFYLQATQENAIILEDCFNGVFCVSP